MNKAGDRIMENYKWTALMKLRGQTEARGGEEILNEFDGFVQSLRGADVDYNIIVLVEGKAPRRFHPQYNTTEPKITRGRSDA
ncbi:MAG: hypothetical protein AUI97_00055 [Crenarchaeota archaeon 13_1_40CM_3_52_17]|nr:MAG: hypothetical protein AUI97_00055 [Crenarchaeota archaeon 13_1_40CM_3_52_17]